MCFFFKQKTAYEMRISDWSSDVCSSDLRGSNAPGLPTKAISYLATLRRAHRSASSARPRFACSENSRFRTAAPIYSPRTAGSRTLSRLMERSEEHTSELQSLMRISYAVFCLKKKTRVIDKQRMRYFLHTEQEDSTTTSIQPATESYL